MRSTLLLILTFFSLTALASEQFKLPSVMNDGGHKRIVLGEKLVNPYTVEHMQLAFDTYYVNNANDPSSGNLTPRIIEPTHQYIKITPTTQQHLDILDRIDQTGYQPRINISPSDKKGFQPIDIGGELSANVDNELVLHDYPLDYEIIEEGDYYIHPQNEQDLFHPVYTVIPYGFEFTRPIPYTVINDVYEPTEDEYDVETLAMQMAGWAIEDDALPSVAKGDEASVSKLFGKRFTPEGHIMISNTQSNNEMQPLQQAKISIGRSIWWKYVHTNNDGYFKSPKKYRGKVRIRAKWRSNAATVRRTWNELLGIQVSDHLMTLKRNANGKTKFIPHSESHLWYKGTVHNGIIKYNQYAAANGINRPVENANVWVWKRGNGAAANPMFKKYSSLHQIAVLAGISQSSVWDVLINLGGATVINLLPARLRPDQLYTGLQTKLTPANTVASTALIEQLVFHESAHFSHAIKAGSWFWAKVVASEFSNYLFEGSPYSDGSEPSFAAGEQIALAEGWATLIEFDATRALYGNSVWFNDSWINLNSTDLDAFQMFTAPMTVFGREDDQSWWLHGLFYDVLDDSSDFGEPAFSNLRNGQNGATINAIMDNLTVVEQFNRHPIFRHLSSSVHNACDFGQKLNIARPLDSEEIVALFDSYGINCLEVIDNHNGDIEPEVEFAWSSAGPISGMYCTHIYEGKDPHTWHDNFMCATQDIGLQWSSSGPISGSRCTQILEPAEPSRHTWHDNYLCLPEISDYSLQWSHAGVTNREFNIQWHEPSDPHTWHDNFLGINSF